MSYQIEKIKNEPILIITCSEDYSITSESAQVRQETLAILDESPQPLYLVADLTNYHKFTMNELLADSQEDARGDNAFLHHPKIIDTIMVSQNNILRLIVKGLNTASFGFLKIHAVNSLEEALQWIEKHQS